LSEAAQAARRIIARCRELAQVSDVPGQTTRLFLSPATREAHVLVGGWIREAGLKLRIDAIGNLRGLLGSEDLPRFVIGSHLDTVRNAGRYDGMLGVLTAITALFGAVNATKLWQLAWPMINVAMWGNAWWE